MAGSITSANATLMLTIASLYPTPIQLQNFAAEDIYDFEEVETVETQRGVDGFLAGGFVYGNYAQQISFKADSASCLIFEHWDQAQRQIQDVYIATLTTTLTSVNRKYNQTGGFLVRTSAAPNAKKILQTRTFRLMWERVTPAPVAATAA